MPSNIWQRWQQCLTPRLWYAFIAVLALAALLKLPSSMVIETNILALLPETEQDPVIASASAQFNDNLSRRHLLLVGHPSLAQAIAAADQLTQTLAANRAIAKWQYRINREQQQQVTALYHPYRHHLLDNATRALLQQGGEAFLAERLRQWYSPMAPLSSQLVQHDPLLIHYHFLLSQAASAGSVSLQQGVLSTEFEGRHYVLINLTLADSPFAIELQQRLLPSLEIAIARLQAVQPELEVINVGVARFANAGVQSAKREISTIGVGSLLGVVVLLWWVFRSGRPLLASLVPMAVGFAAAFVACQWVFGSVHLMSLVFGASLIGISIDYSFHFFCDRLGAASAWQGQAALRRILPGISLGLLTSVLGYAALCFAPFPGMQQMALFSTVGLTAAFLTVACWFPRWFSGYRQPAPIRDGRRLQLIAYLLNALQWPRQWVAWLLLALLAVGAVGLKQLRADDDIALLQASPPALKHEEQRAMAIVGSGISQQFLLIEGGSPAQVQQREEALLVTLNRLVAEQQLQRFDAISRLLPSVAQQQRDRALLQHAVTEPSLLHYGQSLGLAPEPLLRWRKALLAEPAQYLSLDRWLHSEAAKPWQHLWLGPTERGYASVITLYGASGQALTQLQQTGVTVVDKRGDISALLTEYRQRALWLVAISYGVIFVLLSLRYGVGRASLLLLPPAMAVLLVLATLGLTAQPMNVFHLLALLLVLGVGVDYTLFLQEGREHRQQTALAILLSAVTTLLSFGLLALSQTPAVQAFGLTVLIGVATCLLLAPMLVTGTDNKENKNHLKAARPQ